MKEKRQDEICKCCSQSMYTRSSLNKGLAQTLSQMFRFVEVTGKNVFHPEKELLKRGYITSSQRKNVSHLGNHGLIAKHEEAGNWVLTRKAFDFMHGDEFKKIAVVDKASKTTIFYEGEDVTYRDILKSTDVYWYQVDFEVRNGRVITAEQLYDEL